MGDGFLLNPQAVTQRFLIENKQLPWRRERTGEVILRPLGLVLGLRCSIFRHAFL